MSEQPMPPWLAVPCLVVLALAMIGVIGILVLIGCGLWEEYSRQNRR